jgi:ABC-2 type transport system ATP-binding protein
MEEAEYLCDEIAIIDKGKILAFDTPIGLKHKYGDAKTVELGLRDVLNKTVIDLLATIISKSHIDITGTRTLTIRGDNTQEMIIRIIQILSKNDLQVDSIAINPPSLEEIFLTILKDKKE